MGLYSFAAQFFTALQSILSNDGGQCGRWMIYCTINALWLLGRLMDGDHISKEYLIFSEECNQSETTSHRYRSTNIVPFPSITSSDPMDQKDNGVCYKVFKQQMGHYVGVISWHETGMLFVWSTRSWTLNTRRGILHSVTSYTSGISNSNVNC